MIYMLLLLFKTLGLTLSSFTLCPRVFAFNSRYFKETLAEICCKLADAPNLKGVERVGRNQCCRVWKHAATEKLDLIE